VKPLCHDRASIRDTLAHPEPSTVPYDFMCSPPARARLSSYFGRDDLEDAMGLPLRMNGIRIFLGRYPG
jgi:hypothetical protein